MFFLFYDHDDRCLGECSLLQSDKGGIETEFDECKRLLEQDADLELDELKEMFDKKIWSEKETEQKYAAENGVWLWVCGCAFVALCALLRAITRSLQFQDFKCLLFFPFFLFALSPRSQSVFMCLKLVILFAFLFQES